MRKIDAFDIETIPDESKIHLLQEPEVKFGNTKDHEKRKMMINEAKNKQIEKMGLNPFFARTASSSFFGDTCKEFMVICDISDSDEIDLLNFIFDRLMNSDVIVTYNGMEFDFRFIYLRAIILKIELPDQFPKLEYWTRRYTVVPHCDLFKVLNNWKSYSKGDLSLDTAAKIIVGKGKTQRDYNTYLDLIKSGEGEKIGLDNLCDVELTYNLYQRLADYLF